jgi:hypothetical protein
LHAQHAEVVDAINFAQDVAPRVHQRQPEEFVPWLGRAATSMLAAFQRFAKGLYEAFEAVKAGVTLSWSTSPVESHINCLKRLKRQIFGRAHLNLLSRRFVLTPRRGQDHASCPPESSEAHTGAAAAWPRTLIQSWLLMTSGVSRCVEV